PRSRRGRRPWPRGRSRRRVAARSEPSVLRPPERDAEPSEGAALAGDALEERIDGRGIAVPDEREQLGVDETSHDLGAGTPRRGPAAGREKGPVRAVLGADGGREVVAEARREPRARAAGSDRDLEVTALDDRGRKEARVLRHVDDVQPDPLAVGLGAD